MCELVDCKNFSAWSWPSCLVRGIQTFDLKLHPCRLVSRNFGASVKWTVKISILIDCQDRKTFFLCLISHPPCQWSLWNGFEFRNSVWLKIYGFSSSRRSTQKFTIIFRLLLAECNNEPIYPGKCKKEGMF